MVIRLNSKKIRVKNNKICSLFGNPSQGRNKSITTI